MFTVLISFVLVAVLFTLHRRRYINTAWYDTFAASVVSVFAFALLVLGVVEVFVYKAPSRLETVEIKLASMRTTEAVSGSFSGSFVVASGAISSAMVYNVYMLNADGSVTPQRIPASDKLRIIEDRDLHGTGYWTQAVSRKDTSSVRNWVIGNADKHTEFVGNELRVPVGTVLHSFAAQ